MALKSISRETVAFSLAGVSILLRIASDWLFSTGGPLPYQMLQAAFLLLALIALWPHLDLVYLKSGLSRRAIQEGLLALPLGFLAGMAIAWMQFGEPRWPTVAQAVRMLANNLFFPAVEELEFRGFLLAWLISRKLAPTLAVWLAAALHTFAHPHYLWDGNYLSFVSLFILLAWFGGLTLRTRSLWGAYLAHALWNISFFLPLLGAGMER
ncbi:MAG: hypothetical protein A2Z45_03365 [Chloroflexi bacterium RBG_19FT_COMBO_55_16]|nr:MAG: hypothetical protein A2Z45_03365 [Chloroflexi bacterium RBG_19FT_COMBO_55_16]